MYYGAEYTQNKIAELLSVPTGTVSRRLYDARKKLRKELCGMTERKENAVQKESAQMYVNRMIDKYLNIGLTSEYRVN